MKYLIALHLMPVVALAEEKVEPKWYEEIASKLGEWNVSVDDFFTGPAMLGIAGILEIVFRLVKSPKPLSLIHGMIGILKAFEKVLEVVIAGLDKIIPQRTE